MTDWGKIAEDRLADIARRSLDGPGVTRLPFTLEHKAALTLITTWMEAACMTVSMDDAGTLIGRLDAPGGDNRVLILGSHQDSVRHGGCYDGIMGVALACLAVEKICADGRRPRYPIEVHAYADEEGVRFPTALLGPRALAGTFDPAVLDLADASGTALRDALAGFGCDPDEIANLARNPSSVRGYLEMHIEQGPVLEDRDSPLGIVTSICGIERHSVVIEGETGHAGTVPMEMRKDALVTLSRAIADIDTQARAIPDLKATIGTLEVKPGAVNQIPSLVTSVMEIRSPDDREREAFGKRAKHIIENHAKAYGCSVAMHRTYLQAAQQCDPELVAGLSRAIAANGHEPFLLPSGATHDASAMADLCPMAMVFVRCRGGVSHVPEEHASPADMGAAISAMSIFISSL